MIQVCRAAALAVLVAGLLGCTQADARSHSAGPAQLADVLRAAGPGDTVVLKPGVYDNVRMGNRSFSPALTIDASAARLSGWVFRNVTGVTLKGGSIIPPPPIAPPPDKRSDNIRGVRFDNSASIKITGVRFSAPLQPNGEPYDPGAGIGVFIAGSRDVEISGNNFTGLRSGIVLHRVESFRATGNVFERMRSDGIQVAESRHGLVEQNSCRSTRILSTEHPDCIQMWSRAASPPTADMIIRGNRIEGDTQGIGMFNHVRNGVNDGGFDRILIEDNEIDISYPHAIAVYEGRDSVVRNNRIRTRPGSKYFATINVGPDVKRCGNSIAPAAGKRAPNDPKCE